MGHPEARKFLDEMLTLSLDQLKEVPENEMFANADAVLWAKVIGAMEGTRLNSSVQDFQLKFPIGAGRAAFEELECIQRFDLQVLALRTEQDFDRATCANSSQMPAFLQGVEYTTAVLQAAGQPKSDLSVYTKLLRNLKPYKKDGIEDTGYHLVPTTTVK